MISRKILAALLVIGALILTSCSGDDGDIGPKGEDGNANVKSYTFLNKPIVADEPFTLSIPALAQDILEKGLVLIYMEATPTSLGWLQLPYVDGSVNISATNIKVGSVTIRPNTTLAQNYNIKVVLASGVDNTNMRLKSLDLLN